MRLLFLLGNKRRTAVRLLFLLCASPPDAVNGTGPFKRNLTKLLYSCKAHPRPGHRPPPSVKVAIPTIGVQRCYSRRFLVNRIQPKCPLHFQWIFPWGGRASKNKRRAAVRLLFLLGNKRRTAVRLLFCFARLPPAPSRAQARLKEI